METMNSDDDKINVNTIERIVSVGFGALLLRSSLKKFNLLKTIPSIYLIYRGITGRCLLYNAIDLDSTERHNVNVRSYFTINKPREELYQYWRNLENLPSFMEHLLSVKVQENKSTWTAKIPGYHREITWDAEIVKDEPNELIGWQSISNPLIFNAGKVVFKDAPNNQGTEIMVIFSYRPPAGILGEGLAKVLNKPLEYLIANEVRGFKQIMETGERATNKLNKE